MTVVEPGALRFGIQLPVQAQSRTFVQAWESDAGPEEMAAIARTADRAGFLYMGVCDHPVVAKRREAWEGTTWYDPLVSLAYLAAQTDRIRLLTHVLVLPLRHPLLVAKAAATLDHLSGGRLILGVGAGYAQEEFEAVGADYPGRQARTDEAITVLKAAFRDEFPTVSTPWVTLDGSVGARPRPVRADGPPVWVGGSSDRALRRASQLADGWIPQGQRLDEALPMIARVQELRAATTHGPLDIGVYADVRVGADMPGSTISGSVQQVADAFAGHRDAGVGHVLIRFASNSAADLQEQMEMFATEVVPQIGGAQCPAR